MYYNQLQMNIQPFETTHIGTLVLILVLVLFGIAL